MELITGAAGAAQSHLSSFRMRLRCAKQHLDLFALVA